LSEIVPNFGHFSLSQILGGRPSKSYTHFITPVVLMFFIHVFKMFFFIKVKKHVFMFYYLKINVFNIYGLAVSLFLPGPSVCIFLDRRLRTLLLFLLLPDFKSLKLFRFSTDRN